MMSLSRPRRSVSEEARKGARIAAAQPLPRRSEAESREHQMIAIVDYKAGNLTSVARALDHLGHRCEITDRPEKVRAADRVILPGVGAAGATMENLRALGLDECLDNDVAKAGT